MSQEALIKKHIQLEYIKCAKDPIHFMKKYVRIQHPQRGTIPFHLYPFQEKVQAHARGKRRLAESSRPREWPTSPWAVGHF